VDEFSTLGNISNHIYFQAMTAFPKTNHYRDPHLLALARDRECLLRIPGVCNQGETVAAHSNAGIHAKGKAIKAHDYFSVWACPRCHTWLDHSYVASREERRDAFDAAYTRQLAAWLSLSIDQTETERNRRAAHDALMAYEKWRES
jgi:hypothetical protein